MKKLSLTLAVVALASVGAQADFLLSFPTPTADSGATDDLYGIQTYYNQSSTVGVSVSGGAVIFTSKLASDGTTGYTANVGVLIPITPDWSAHDLTGVTGVSFKYKASAKITDVFAVSFGSAAYTDEIAKAGTTYEADITPTSSSVGKLTQGQVDIADFSTPSWWTAPEDFPKLATVLTKVKNLQFAPKTTYTGAGTKADGTACTGCVGPTLTSITLELQDITLLGIDGITSWPNPDKVGCDATQQFSVLDDFVDGDNKNSNGGYWFDYSDFDSLGTSTDPAKGASLASDTIIAGEEGLSSGTISLHARLNKMVGTTWRKYSGFAALGTKFKRNGTADLTGLTAIGFTIKADTIGPNVPSVLFKVAMAGVNDTAVHYAELPSSALRLGQSACIRPADLKQASYLVDADKVVFDPSTIVQLAWEAKIADTKNSAITTDTVSFHVTDVTLYGVTDDYTVTSSGSGVKSRNVAKPFAVSYRSGILSLSGFQGVAQCEVFNLDGTKVAAFAPQAQVALNLPRGTYFLASKRDGARVVQSFSVLGR